MKLLMNLLLWTTEMEDDMLPILENLKAMGFDGMEVPMFSTDQSKWKKWSHHFDQLGLYRIAVTYCDAAYNPISPDAQTRRKAIDRLKQLTECSQLLGADILAGPIHSALNVFTGKGPTQEEWNWSVEAIRQVTAYAKSGGITLGIEYLNRFENYLVSCTDDVLRFVRDVNHPNCRIMFDTFHANIEEKNIADAFRKCAAEVAYVQISENDRSTPGKGHVEWTSFFDALKDTDYQGCLSIEAFGRRQPDLAAATKIWRAMFESEDQLARDGLAFLQKEVSKRFITVNSQ